MQYGEEGHIPVENVKKGVDLTIVKGVALERKAVFLSLFRHIKLTL